MSRKVMFTLVGWITLTLGLGFAASAEPVRYVLETPGVV